MRILPGARPCHTFGGRGTSKRSDPPEHIPGHTRTGHAPRVIVRANVVKIIPVPFPSHTREPASLRRRGLGALEGRVPPPREIPAPSSVILPSPTFGRTGASMIASFRHGGHLHVNPVPGCPGPRACHVRARPGHVDLADQATLSPCPSPSGCKAPDKWLS